MATITRWNTPTAKATALSSSQLDNLAHQAQKISASISNDGLTELYLYMDVQLKLSASTANRCANAYCKLWLLPDLGDSSYAYGSTALDPAASSWIGNFLFDSGQTAARVQVLTMIPIPPENFKLVLENDTGKLFSCCTVLSYRRYDIRSS
jgi:hypothetical protein